MATKSADRPELDFSPLIDHEQGSLGSPLPAPEPSAVDALARSPGSLIDHTLLAPGATPAEIARIVDEAVRYRCATVCVNSSYVPLVRDRLKAASSSSSSPSPEAAETAPIAVVGFPLGAAATEAKVFEAKWAIENGAKEIDMVQHVGRLKAKDYSYVYEDVRAVVEACGSTPVKVILETCLLSEHEIVAASVLAREVRPQLHAQL